MCRSRLCALSALLVLGSCVTPPDQGLPPEPVRELPESFGPADTSSAESSLPDAADVNWEDYFAEPELCALIEAALAGNQELSIRVQEVLMAQYEVLARSGEYRPRVDAFAGVGLEKVGEVTSQGVSDAAHGVPEDLSDFRLGLAASWEVDIWRRLRDLTDAASARYLAGVEGRNFLATGLVAEIAGSYYELTALDSQLAVLERNIAIQQDALEVVRRRSRRRA
jgi:multidrug efflux system outer membrane protein